jgi:catechol 2,3-dioxygenase-like lactoylglutathione lyase family enzyme
MLGLVGLAVFCFIIGYVIACTSNNSADASAESGGMYKLHHIGIIVQDLDAAVSTYADILGLEPGDPRIEEPISGKANETVMVTIGAEEDYNYFELMEPNEPEDPDDVNAWLDTYLKKYRAEGLFHVVILIDNFDAKVETLIEKGYTVKVQETPEPFEGCDLLREAYILPKDGAHGVLIDFIDAEHFPASKGGLAS